MLISMKNNLRFHCKHSGKKQHAPIGNVFLWTSLFEQLLQSVIQGTAQKKYFLAVVSYNESTRFAIILQRITQLTVLLRYFGNPAACFWHEENSLLSVLFLLCKKYQNCYLYRIPFFIEANWCVYNVPCRILMSWTWHYIRKVLAFIKNLVDQALLWKLVLGYNNVVYSVENNTGQWQTLIAWV